MAIVKFTRNLKRFYPDLKPFESPASTLQHLLSDVDSKYPGICNYILDETGSIRKHVQIFIQNKAIMQRDNLGIQIESNDEIYIMQALSGG